MDDFSDEDLDENYEEEILGEGEKLLCMCPELLLPYGRNKERCDLSGIAELAV